MCLTKKFILVLFSLERGREGERRVESTEMSHLKWLGLWHSEYGHWQEENEEIHKTRNQIGVHFDRTTIATQKVSMFIMCSTVAPRMTKQQLLVFVHISQLFALGLPRKSLLLSWGCGNEGLYVAVSISTTHILEGHHPLRVSSAPYIGKNIG